HIFEAIEAAVTPADRTFELILHPVPERPAKGGVKANDLDEEKEVIPPLEKKMKTRFEQTWATLVSKKNPDGLFASAYHIKVAVRDGNAFWLSSGNWQSSNQPNFAADAPSRGSLGNADRDWHVVVMDEGLAQLFQAYIDHDFQVASGVQADKAALQHQLKVAIEAAVKTHRAEQK